jgi:hypothetical protein
MIIIKTGLIKRLGFLLPVDSYGQLLLGRPQDLHAASEYDVRLISI